MVDPARVKEIFMDCLFKQDELVDGKPTSEHIEAQGVGFTAWFNPVRVKKYKPEIIRILNQMNPTFKEGWSFLNLCYDKNEKLWTGNHRTMDELLCLGLATKTIQYCCEDRNLWTMFPGGMPYIKII